MVKRASTPEYAEDADFYTVSQPYPLNFERDRDDDVKSFVRWVAACLGATAPVWAFYYKPSVRRSTLSAYRVTPHTVSRLPPRSFSKSRKINRKRTCTRSSENIAGQKSSARPPKRRALECHRSSFASIAKKGMYRKMVRPLLSLSLS